MTTQTVTFTVTDSSEAAVEGAIVDVQGARLKTNSSGQAVFNLPAGSYVATVKKKGYKTETENVTVTSSAVTKSVTLTTA